MFTVVISQQTHLDNIAQYKPFLKPFLEQPGIGFCRWRQNGNSLEEAVPDLYDTVARHSAWRAIVVCDDEGLELQNPFNLVSYTEPERPEDMEEEAYCQLRREKKEEAFVQAANKPLTRLMTWLCQSPIVTEGFNNIQDTDPEFAAYLQEYATKDRLRKQIINGRVPDVDLPAEVICVACRCFEREAIDIQTSWANNPDIRYSRFYDWNMYFDKMRYLIFDILPKNHRNYEFDYIRFLYALMVLAENPVPMATLSPNRVYTLECHNDERALQRLLVRYDAKLAVTKERISGEIRKLKGREMPRLSNQDADMIFCSGVAVPVVISNEFDRSAMFIPPTNLGLSTDCPESEEDNWTVGVQKSRKALTRFLKLPRRSVKKAASDMRRLDTADLDFALRLNEFQLEDVAEYTAEEEMRMVSAKTSDIYNTKKYTEQMQAQDEQVKAVIATRMTRRITIGVGLAALLCFFAGFIPMFLSNANTVKSFLFSLLFVGVGLLIMVITSILTLWRLRRPLKEGYGNYNDVMDGIVDEVEASMTGYSLYLSHACNVMRGNSVLNFCSEHENPEESRIRILRKHEVDIDCHRQELRDLFGMYMPERVDPADCEDFFSYDFTRPVDFAYPLPYSDEQTTKIEFMQKGNYVTVPVDFVKRISVRREELYDA